MKQEMKTREAVIKYCIEFDGCYIDAPFHDNNWTLARLKRSKRSFVFIYERNGYICINVKVDPEIRDFLRNSYEAIQNEYIFNKKCLGRLCLWRDF